jgi:DNA-binding response OmpR family regulator
MNEREATVLIVEDSDLVSIVLQEVVEALGWRALGPATRVAEACAMARDADFDVALVDIDLDGEMAWPVGGVLKARGAPFAFMTGYSQASIAPPEFQGAPIIRKPFTLEEVKRQLEALLAARASPREQSPGA